MTDPANDPHEGDDAPAPDRGAADPRQPDRIAANAREHGDGGRGPEDFDPVENLLGDDPDETMQTGYNPPDREPHSLRDAPTGEEQREGASLDERLTEENPDVSEQDAVAGPPEERAGRLVSEEENLRHREAPDGVAKDVGPAGYASSAEEAAVRVTDEDDEDGRR